MAATGAASGREGAEAEAAAVDPSYAAARNAIAERRYAEALRSLYGALAVDPLNADTHNLLGYATVRRLAGTFEVSCAGWSPPSMRN